MLQSLPLSVIILKKFGLIKFWRKGKVNRLNFIPVDYVTNATILSSWYKANKAVQDYKRYVFTIILYQGIRHLL